MENTISSENEPKHREKFVKIYTPGFLRRKFRTAEIPYGKISARRKFLTAKLSNDKIPHGGNSVQRKFRTAKNTYSEKSYGENSYGENSYTENSLPYFKCTL